MSKPYLLLALVLATACRNDNGGDVDGSVNVDTPNGVGCTSLSPRSSMPETFTAPTGLQNRINAFIDGAQTSLDVEMYLFTVQSIAQKIVAAKNRGVMVRVLLDPDHPGNDSVRPIFTSAGVAWKNMSALYEFSHAKFMIADHSEVLIMSANFNVDAMSNERNYGFIDKDPEDIADAQAIYDQDWALASGQTPTPPDLKCTRLIISPVNSVPRITEFINNAKTKLDVEALYLSDTGIRTAVGNAADRGVSVRVILETPDDQSTNAATTTYLKGKGVPVKYVTNQFYLHAKLIIADGIALVGSQNYSYTSLNRNRELAALIFEPTAVVPIQQQFDADWAVTVPAP